jgi:uncharacterized protein (TIGR02145 family)
MRTKLFLSILLSLDFCFLSSQIPQGFNYQAIARNSSGNPIINTTLPVIISIQSDSINGTIFWEELHSSVTTNGFGLFTLVIGKGARQASSTVASFNDINWSVTPKFIRTQVYYNSQLLNMGSSRLWSVPFSMAAMDLTGPVDKLEVVGKTNVMDESLFEVKNKDGQTVFAVYNGGVRIYVDDGNAKGGKGGFAIGGFDKTKGEAQNYLVVNQDSIRAYIDTNPEKARKGGFAVGGFDKTKATNEEYLRVTRDSTRIYLNDTGNKARKGGFAIGGFGKTKGEIQDYFVVNQDSIRAYIDTNAGKSRKGGFAVGGFSNGKEATNDYLSVTSDSVKVSKSLLIPRLTTEERDNLPFVPGEALIIFNITEGCMQIFKNNVWSNIWCFNCSPAFIIQPIDKIICSSEKAIFFVSATGTNLNYQWQESTNGGGTWSDLTNGGSNPSYSGAKGYTLTLSNVPVGHDNYKYRCIVNGSCPPNIISNIVTLNVGSKPPVIATQPTDQVLSLGCTANFSVVSPGYGVLYQWQKSSDGGNTWVNISDGGTAPVFAGVTTSTLTFSNVPLASVINKYRCIVRNLCGDDAISNVVVLTPDMSTAIILQPLSLGVLPGHNTSFSIATSGSGFTYQWQESVDGGGTWNDVANGGNNPTYTGTTDTTLSLLNVPITYNNFRYCCKVSHFCRLDEISSAATLSIPVSGSTTDLDGNSYITVSIGSQVWMAENLKTTKYNDNTTIPLVTNAAAWSNLSTPGYCWYNNDEDTYKNIEGALYNWHAVNTGKICPTGWHVPTDAEWHTLTLTLDADARIDIVESLIAGGKLKEAGAAHWSSPNIDATNETGFTALPSGFRDTGYFFNVNNNEGFWWSSTEVDTNSAVFRDISSNFGGIFILERDKKTGYSVRCLKDY